MNFRTARRLAACAASLLVAGAAHADYLWLQPDGGRARVQAGELGKPLAQLPALDDARPVLPEGKTLPLETAADHYAFQPQGPGDQRFTAVRAGADGVLTYFQARYGRAEAKALNDLELVPTEPNGNRFQLYFKGRPVAASQVNVQTSEGWRRTLAPAADGTVGFTPWMPGLYVLEVTARVNNGSVTREGKKYDDVRHTATLAFEVQR
ncbi:hypothetical protein [Pseudorhodoferax sp.]|uniref:hypothetical protein n=1 Tax=Pseudorhodoferax sp. TaxID=1993553 RepID=UPI002DD6ADA3|nr:hypothetical protein [Pseudorhodoferax sp.]